MSPEPLRVGIDVTPLVGEPTGIHQSVRHLTDALAERSDIELSGWLLSSRGRKPDFPGQVHRSPLPARVAYRTWRYGSFPQRRLLAGPVDVVHGTNFLGPPEPTTVLSIQDLTPLTRPDLTTHTVAAKGQAIRRALEAGAWAHTSCHLIADELRSIVDTDRLGVVHHGLPPTPTPRRGSGHRQTGFDRYVVTVGTTERRKRVPDLVRILNDLPADIGLAIVGPAGNQEEAVQEAILAYGLGNRVRRLTDLSDQQRTDVIADSIALALASEYEGFAFTPLEALQLGVPVAATAVGALPELIGDMVELAAPNGDNLASLLHAACEQPTVPAGVAERLAGLTWERSAAGMMDLYRQAAGW